MDLLSFRGLCVSFHGQCEGGIYGHFVSTYVSNLYSPEGVSQLVVLIGVDLTQTFFLFFLLVIFFISSFG